MDVIATLSSLSEDQDGSFQQAFSNKLDPLASNFTIIWDNLSYKVNTETWFSRVKDRLSRPNVSAGSENFSGNNRNKIILNKICGDVKSRQLTAIMGPSGAGKSSLLNCLFQNRRLGVSGRIVVESKNKNKLKVCFIPQNDCLNEWLTVREDLMFVSKLKSARLNRSILGEVFTGSQTSSSYVKHDKSNQPNTILMDHEANALWVAELLGLENCLDVPIKKISGGQKKRLSVARELMSKPDILVLDEPTTGLDSVTCYKTIKVLSELAHNSTHPMAIVVTIHQPEKSVFNMFDKTYFLSRTGSVIYDGSPRLAMKTMEDVANLSLPTSKYNPAAFIIEVASDKKRGNFFDCLSEHQRATFNANFSPSHIELLMRSKSRNSITNWNFCSTRDRCSAFSEEIQTSLSSATQPVTSSDEASSSIQYRSDGQSHTSSNGHDEYYMSLLLSNHLSSHSSDVFQSFRHVFILTHRSWLSFTRNPTFTRSRLAFHTILPFMMLAVFGIQFGSPNNCPKLDGQLSMGELSRNIKSGVIAQNVEETRLTLENMSFFFILLYGFAINIISSTASYYPLTLHMFKKERINGLYSASPFFIGQMLAELPFEMFFPTLSILIYYPLSGQISSFMEWRMLTVAYIVFLVSYCIHSLGILSGSMFANSISIALLFGQVSIMPHVMLSGYIIRFSRMSEWMKKLSHLSIFRQGLAGITVARFGFGICDCDEDMIQESGFEGMAPNVRHALEYMFPENETISGDPGNSGAGLSVTDIFDKMADKFSKVQSMAMDIKSCQDVRPYLLQIMTLKDSDIFVSIVCLVLMTSFFKLASFYFVKSFPYRMS